MPAAMCRTAATARLSPLPAPDAWPRWKQKGFWSRKHPVPSSGLALLTPLDLSLFGRPHETGGAVEEGSLAPRISTPLLDSVDTNCPAWSSRCPASRPTTALSAGHGPRHQY